MEKPKILVVDDEVDILNILKFLLEREGYEVDTTLNGEEAIKKIEKNYYDIVLTDLRMPGISGIVLLEKTKELSPSTEVVIMTAYASIESAVEAIKKGAADYIVKPFINEDLKMRLRRILEHKKLQREVEILKYQLSQKITGDLFFGTSPQMQEILKLLERITPTKSTVLILGESGTGKGVLAEFIHYNSPRKDKPFISINCSAIPETLLESELFGYKKGAFTGAVSDKKGLIELANEGTLFLDEIGDMPLNLQAKILKFLEFGEFIPLGDTVKKQVDVRVIAATNKDLEALIKEGKFREDLYYRLNVIEIKIPPLRERKEDIPALTYFFIDKLSKEHGKKIKGITSEALTCLMQYNWPGNVRELKNVIERAIILATEEYITLNELPERIKGEKNLSQSFKPLKEALEEFEKNIILKTLKQCAYNKEKAAQLLGIDLATLYRKLKKYQLTED
ncbi:MAG: Fis family transcriptional regulator [Caldimicrobium thiodismutans]|uniref:Fis family transcriptional regulator n=1 Tax=Caldimicrobium thiodismutans TaxID=1653476 RepID=A0A2N7PLI8_9BACT|nr:MAG: Fis family transcriptional regulator [Caldimicrobium thiodismutans]